MFGILKKFNKLLDRTQKKKIGILLVIMIIGAGLETLSVSMLLPLMTALMNEDIMQENDTIRAFCSFVGISSYKSFVLFCLIFFIILYFLKGGYSIFQNYALVRFVCNNRLAMQRSIYKRVISKPYEFFLNAESGEIIHMIQIDPAAAYGMLQTLLLATAESIISLALAVTIFIIEPFISTLLAVVLLILIVIISKVVKPAIRNSGLIFRIVP